ncbi:MAG: hypothetical protein QF483_00640 [Gammaproteobacteria bacterium]|nr:hypothetical protein [Gammaproteobacteria bacterium]
MIGLLMQRVASDLRLCAMLCYAGLMVQISLKRTASHTMSAWCVLWVGQIDNSAVWLLLRRDGTVNAVGHSAVCRQLLC